VKRQGESSDPPDQFQNVLIRRQIFIRKAGTQEALGYFLSGTFSSPTHSLRSLQLDGEERQQAFHEIDIWLFHLIWRR